jgi:hypothetical protein
MKLKTTRKLMMVAAIGLISGSIVVYAATTLFSQTIPSVGSANVLTAGCLGTTPLTNEGSPIPVVGSSGVMLVDCGSGNPAFVSNGGTATPTFALPSAYSALYAVPSPASLTVPPCSTSATGAVELTSGSPATLPAGVYSYCAAYSNWPVGGAASFGVTWSEG